MSRRALASVLPLLLLGVAVAAEEPAAQAPDAREACATRARARVDTLEAEQGKLAARERELSLKSAYDTCLEFHAEAEAEKAAAEARARGDAEGVAAGTGAAGAAAQEGEKKGFNWREFFMRGANKPRVRGPHGKKIYRE